MVIGHGVIDPSLVAVGDVITGDLLVFEVLGLGGAALLVAGYFAIASLLVAALAVTHRVITEQGTGGGRRVTAATMAELIAEHTANDGAEHGRCAIAACAGGTYWLAVGDRLAPALITLHRTLRCSACAELEAATPIKPAKSATFNNERFI